MATEMPPAKLILELGQDRLPAFVLGVVSAVTGDSGRVRAANEAWDAGKTVHLRTEVDAGSGPVLVDAHLAVSSSGNGRQGRDGLIALLVDYIGRGGVSVFDGRTLDRPEVHTAFVIPLPGASVLVGVLGDSLLVHLSDETAAHAPAPTHNDGVSYVAESGAAVEEGFRLELVDGQMTLIGIFPHLHPREIRGLAKPVRMALRRFSPRLLFVGFKLPGFSEDWIECPFSLAIIPAGQRHLAMVGRDGRLPFLLRMAMHETMEVVYERRLMPTPGFTSAFVEMVDEQSEQPGLYSPEDYARDVQAIRSAHVMQAQVFSAPGVIHCMAGR